MVSFAFYLIWECFVVKGLGFDPCKNGVIFNFIFYFILYIFIKSIQFVVYTFVYCKMYLKIRFFYQIKSSCYYYIEENSLQLFSQNTPSQTFDRVLDTPLQVVKIYDEFQSVGFFFLISTFPASFQLIKDQVQQNSGKNCDPYYCGPVFLSHVRIVMTFVVSYLLALTHFCIRVSSLQRRGRFLISYFL